jgi:hypothetical protein
MITKLTLKNFKSVGEQEYDFTLFDLLVGRNNSGKSTVLQALAIWQFCMDEFHRSKRTGSKGIQVVLPNFTALPVPEFNLLWKERTDRKYPDGKQEFILIEIHLEWTDPAGGARSFGVAIRYHSPQTIYAIPIEGWAKLREYEQASCLPKIAYVPPFSGLEPTEKWLDVSPIRQQVGKGQPGSVLRNLLLRVCPPAPRDEKGRIQKRAIPEEWTELTDVVDRWFSVKLKEPRYESERDVHISVDYRQESKDYDIISGGSGFHQALTLLAFLFGYHPTTILLDEPDAHLHVNLQRAILDYFKLKSIERQTQFIIATHAEEFANGVNPSQIVSLLSQKPRRIESTPPILRALAEVRNEEIARLMASPFILYVEGESDERILRAWATICEASGTMDQICFKAMGGGSKDTMKANADEHFEALKQILPECRRMMLFDFDTSATAFHPDPKNPVLCEWSRKNIENYLLVPDAWKRATRRKMGFDLDNLFTMPPHSKIDEFFTSQNLTLPPGRTWRNVTANIFSVVDGKLLLFENEDSLFHQLRTDSPSLEILRENLAMSMTPDEIHEDVWQVMSKLIAMTVPS